MTFKKLLGKQMLFFDGATGTQLQARGLQPGELPESWNFTHPDIVEAVHRSYLDVGSNIVKSNTFGANPLKLAGSGLDCKQTIEAAVAIAKKACGGRENKFVALNLGPTGKLLQPYGDLPFEKAVAAYGEMVRYGAAAGADLILIETMSDTYEIKAAVLAAKENSDLPVCVTMTFDEDGKLLTGATVEAAALMCEGLGVDAIGFNCGLGPVQVGKLFPQMLKAVSLPLIINPNAGLPVQRDGKTCFDVGPEEYAELMYELAQQGASIVGGCCGTTPEHIAQMIAKCKSLQPGGTRECSLTAVSSYGKAVHLGEGPIIIGERINPTGKKRFQQALRERDFNYIMERAIEQQDAGADILDINVGLPGIDEAEMMTAVVKAVQSVVSLPLQIDSSDPAAIEAGLRACSGRAIVNSVNAEQDKLDTILPIVKKYGAAVVGLTMDKSGIPQTAQARFDMAEKIMQEAMKHGIPKEDVLIDCLTLTISAQQEQAVETLKAVRMVHEKLGLHCVLGVSNISFGLPERNNITTNFLTQAMWCGLDLPIINPNLKPIMDTVVSYRALSGEDVGCEAYIERFANVEEEPKSGAAPKEMNIADAVLKGLKQETADLTEKLLETMSELDVINQKLIPALDLVGDKYEKQKIFLPQLINAANAACAGFDLIKLRIAKRGGESVSKGKIIMATVEGDIHDIGKNIVRVVLENYGYQVIDLGRDVPVQKVVDTAIAEDVKLVGLSALMTTTVDSMRRTIEALRASGHDCKVMVGGAVLTADYAEEIGADYYTKDAKASVDVAKEVLG